MKTSQNRAVGENSHDVFKQVIPTLNKPNKDKMHRVNVGVCGKALDRARNVSHWDRRALVEITSIALSEYIDALEKARGSEYPHRTSELVPGARIKY